MTVLPSQKTSQNAPSLLHWSRQQRTQPPSKRTMISRRDLLRKYVPTQKQGGLIDSRPAPSEISSDHKRYRIPCSLTRWTMQPHESVSAGEFTRGRVCTNVQCP